MLDNINQIIRITANNNTQGKQNAHIKEKNRKRLAR